MTFQDGLVDAIPARGRASDQGHRPRGGGHPRSTTAERIKLPDALIIATAVVIGADRIVDRRRSLAHPGVPVTDPWGRDARRLRRRSCRGRPQGRAARSTRGAGLGHELIDLGGDGSDPNDDYPDFAQRLGEAIQGGEADRGILICGSGVGASVAANKMRGIRSAVCHDTYSAHQGVEHDDMNVLTLGARVIGPEPAYECAVAFLGATFSGEPRHRRRLDKVLAIEAAED